MDLISQLVDFYYDEKAEWWIKERMSRNEAWLYHEKLLNQGNIITVQDSDILCGYVEFWRVSFQDFGRLVCQEPFSAFHENVINGQIAYVANTYIRPEYRQGKVYKIMRNRFWEVNKECTHFVGRALRKTSSQPIKVFKVSDIHIEKYIQEKEMAYGR